jgi:hypothetical protein
MGVTLSWTADADAINGYNVYRGATSGGESSTPLNISPILITSYTDDNPMAGANFYVIKAIGVGGTLSPASSEVEFFMLTGSASLAGAGTLSGNVTTRSSSVSISGTGTVSAAVISSSAASVALSGQGSVTATLQTRSTAGAITGTGTVVAQLINPYLQAFLLGSAALYGTEINGTPAISAVINGQGSLSGNIISTTPSTGNVSVAQNLIQALASSSGSNPNPSLTFSSPVTAGDLLVSAVAYTATSGIPNVPAITDTQGNSWIEVGLVPAIYKGVVVNLVLFWTIARTTGSLTVNCSTATITSPSNVWMVIAEFSGANELAIISGSSLGYGVNPPYDGSSLSGTIQATNPPLTTPTGALLIAVATTYHATASWSVDPGNNWYSIAAQGGGIVLAYAKNMYINAPFCDMTPPRPILDRSGDSSVHWVILTAPFTTNLIQPTFPNSNVPSPEPNFQYPSYPYDPNSQE